MLSNLLRNTLITAAITFPIISLSGQNALASDRRNFLVKNNNELEIIRLHVSSASSRYWGRNILNKDITSGGSGMVSFSNSSNQCFYDIKAVYSNRTHDINRVNLCRVYSIRFNGHGGTYRGVN
ncbi:MAG: hypothetical protein QNJ63_08530 [Calothrix sp. MO_192.B10]|nr:hypothetical protein [Calothrix sp. MO_192.B10]